MEVEIYRKFFAGHFKNKHFFSGIRDERAGKIEQDVEVFFPELHIMVRGIGIVQAFSGDILFAVKPSEKLVDLLGLSVEYRLIPGICAYRAGLPGSQYRNQC
jgi:hypothetical protein